MFLEKRKMEMSWQVRWKLLKKGGREDTFMIFISFLYLYRIILVFLYIYKIILVFLVYIRLY